MPIDSPVAISIIIPVYNGAGSIARVVGDVRDSISPLGSCEIVLVNDCSPDNSAEVCRQLAAENPGLVCFVNLARNFGEHNAVLAGLSQCRGSIAAVLDDDGQNPPEELPKLIAAVRAGADVAYGRYIDKKHDSWRNWGSRFNNWVATQLTDKPPEIYLSSFKAMNRLVIDHLVSHCVPNPYIDSLIFQCTRNVVQVDVSHLSRSSGHSNYTFRRLVRLWLNMLTTASHKPLRLATYLGLVAALLGLLTAMMILIEYFVLGISVPGWSSLFLAVCFFSAFQLVALGLIGEYIGRIFQSGHRPAFVIREISQDSDSPTA